MNLPIALVESITLDSIFLAFPTPLEEECCSLHQGVPGQPHARSRPKNSPLSPPPALEGTQSLDTKRSSQLLLSPATAAFQWYRDEQSQSQKTEIAMRL